MGYKNNDYPKHFVEKYQGIPYIPLDIPKIEPDDDFWELWNTRTVPIVRLKPDHRYPFDPEQAEEHQRLTGRMNEYTTPNWQGMVAHTTDDADDRWTRSLVDGKKLLPKFFQQLRDHLPVSNISQVLFWSNQREIGLHRDLHEQHPFPCSLRIMIHDENTQPTFYLQPLPLGLQGIGSEKIKFQPEIAKFVDLTGTDTNSFVYNNGQWIHGAMKIPGRSKILCSLGVGWKWTEYERLLDRSIERHGRIT
jgi:hypothetical protein